ncbi:glycosyltransferase [Leuconostoc mesenteroides]|uniref:glycosyltransferase n=1 Tax=Leuconostoc mesenteroides TaxID=1245 RepID=UPI001CBFB034|nr:glycosyltransferase [Leuconostoc mesenteroides]MBZ1518985.1 glycosyltransferase [Leuconostoc mesenteroides]MBZ1521535.1 glycosyltransferase [Leuconostoc mesenteroides]MBZ1523426.1 glycosyltransferase [Leuconostoc mesenteroides]
MNVPVVSVLMGVYNGESTIAASIESIKRQTFSDWELIIYNDGSTDFTDEILKKYSRNDSRIVIIDNQGKNGLASGLNKCLSVARGKYIARMDDDDISLQQRFSKQVEYLDKNSYVDAVGTGMIVFDDIADRGIRRNETVVTKDSFLKGSPFFHPTIMIKREVLQSLGGYREDVGRAEDLDLWFRFFQAGYVGTNLKEPLIKYHEDVTDYKKRTLRSGIITCQVLFKGYKAINIPFKKRWRALKPFFSALIPNKLMAIYHESTLDRKL